FLTCASEKSRNFRFGQRIATGESAQTALEALGTVEGLHALRGLLQAVAPDQAPIAAALWAVIHDGLAPQAAVEALMQRPVRAG
ncbi:MAG: NAD(P)H-dependent glycerol-3-phosphate dehydrogenase, partial [Pseudomonadota bacterium]